MLFVFNIIFSILCIISILIIKFYPSIVHKNHFKNLVIFFIIKFLFISLFIYWCFTYAYKIENKYVSTLIVGYAALIYAHMIINLGMISGLFPVTGLPAPFISYGGSFFKTSIIFS